MDRLPDAFIVCGLLVLLALAITWFVRLFLGRIQETRRRRAYNRSLLFILKDFVRFCYQEYKTATFSLRALEQTKRDEVVRNFTVSGSPEYLSKLGFILFQSSDSVLFQEDTLKTSSTLFSLRDQIISQQEHVNQFVRYAAEVYRKEEKLYDDNFYALRLLFDKLRMHTDSVSDLRTAEWIDAYFRVFSDYVTQGRSRDIGVSHPEVVQRILRIGRNFRDVAFAVDALEHALRCDHAYARMVAMDEALTGQLRHFAHTHRLAYKIVTRIITRMDTPVQGSTGKDILRDLFMAGAWVRPGANRKATVKAKASGIPGWRGLLARISGIVLIACGVLLFADTLFYTLPHISLARYFRRDADTLCVPVAKTIKGMDLSKYLGDFLMNERACDVDFIICKATEGSYLTDPDFAERWQYMQKACGVRGAYHFYYDNGDPIKQAQHFVKVVQRFGSGDVPIVAIEHGSTTGAANPYTLQTDLMRFLQYAERTTGRRPMIYTNRQFANDYLRDPAFGKYPLWLADYSGAEEPVLPEAWKDKGFTFWQRHESYAGGASPNELDIFNGDSAALQAFASGVF